MISCCTPLAENGNNPSRLSEAELSKLEKVKDAANRECYAHEMGSINFYVDISDKHLGSMETQIIEMYKRYTGNHLTPTNAMNYRSMVKSWAFQNLDIINAGFRVEGELKPRHVFVGIQPRNKKEKLWHYGSGKDVVGKSPGFITYGKAKYTHVMKYKAGPETIQKAQEFLNHSKKHMPHYHWNANKLRSLDGKTLSNCLVFVVDTIKASGIDTSSIDNIRDPWEIAKKLPPKR